MTIKNFDIESFYHPWEGAVDTWNKIRDADKVEEFENFLDEQYPDGMESVTELNDLLWFDSDWVLFGLGLDEDDDDDEEDEE